MSKQKTVEIPKYGIIIGVISNGNRGQYHITPKLESRHVLSDMPLFLRMMQDQAKHLVKQLQERGDTIIYVDLGLIDHTKQKYEQLERYDLEKY